MQIIMDLHTHTTYSHGESSVEQNAAEAKRKGLQLLGIADHGAGHTFFGVNAKKMALMRADIDRINADAGRVFVLQGVEANILDGAGTTDIDSIKGCPLDITLLGYHQGSLPRTVQGLKFYKKAISHSSDIAKVLTNALIRAMERYAVDVITHPGEYLPIDMKRLAQAARSNGVALEINASHGTDVRIIKTALAEGARFILSSDAHKALRVGEVSSAIRDATSASVPASHILNAQGYCWDCEMRLNRLRKLIT